VPLLRQLGWHVTVVERRPRWTAPAALADVHLAQAPEAALRAAPRAFDAALVMHHDFDRDREALAALADAATGFIGLLGPVRRREDLFRLLPAAAREALAPRLHSPVGLDLGGQGPEAIALSIAAQLHARRHSP
jgi:xanthine dehydrogenase accessory factor